MIIEWSDDFCTHVEEIDAHHKHLFDILNRIIRSAENKNRFEIHSILEELNAYAHYHFAAEEQLFKDTQYPLIAKHLEEHAYFLNTVAALLQQAKVEGSFITFDTTQFLTQWITDHILHLDLAYVPFLQSSQPI